MIELLTCICLTLSTPSIHGFGSAKGMYHISAGEAVQVHYFHNTRPKIADNNLQSSLGVSYRLQSKVVEAGALLTNRGFPSEKGSRFNFLIDVGYSFEWGRISYGHISNGFGLWNEFNDGFDSINMRLRI